MARLLEIPRPETSLENGKAEARSLIAETSRSFDQAKRYAELTQFEFEESPSSERTSLENLEETLSRAEEIFTSAKSLVQGDERQNQSRTALQSEIAAEVRRLERLTTGG